MEDFNEIIRNFKFSFNVLAYPVLEDLKYLRVYNEFIQKSIEAKMTAVDSLLSGKNGAVNLLELEVIEAISYQKRDHSFQNTLKASLLMAIYATLENIVTLACSQEDRLSRYNEYKRNKKKSMIAIALDFLSKEGFTEVKNIKGWKVIDDMRKIRNRFAHSNGQTNAEINEVSNRYDLKIDNDQIILGDFFIDNFIQVTEDVAVKFVKIVYPE